MSEALECKKCEHRLRLQLQAAARGGFSCPKAHHNLYFTPFTNVATGSVISHGGTELCLASAPQKAKLEPTQKEKKILLVPAAFPQTTPLCFLKHCKSVIAALGFASPSEVLHCWVSNTAGFRGNDESLKCFGSVKTAGKSHTAFRTGAVDPTVSSRHCSQLHG